MLYEQSALDGLAVDGMEGGLKFIVHQYPDTVSASVSRDEVVKLRNALSDWLWPDNGDATPPPAAPQADHSLIDQLIRRAAAEAVTAATPPEYVRSLARMEFEKLFDEKVSARVLPLHLSPVADPEDCRCGKCHRDRGPQGRINPEPNETGCFCGHWSGWHGTRGCLKPGSDCTCQWTGPEDVPEDHGRLMAELPRRVRPEACVSCGMPWPHTGAHPRHLCRCGHCSRQHAGSYGYGECGVAGCECGCFG